MESRAKIAGHPAHPMFIVFPIGLFVVGTIFDIIALASGEMAWATAAFWNIAAGGIGAAVAAVFGLIDWLAVPDGTRAKAIGLYHAIGNVVVLALFAISWGVRWDEPARRITTGTLV